MALKKLTTVLVLLFCRFTLFSFIAVLFWILQGMPNLNICLLMVSITKITSKLLLIQRLMKESLCVDMLTRNVTLFKRAMQRTLDFFKLYLNLLMIFNTSYSQFLFFTANYFFVGDNEEKRLLLMFNRIWIADANCQKNLHELCWFVFSGPTILRSKLWIEMAKWYR